MNELIPHRFMSNGMMPIYGGGGGGGPWESYDMYDGPWDFWGSYPDDMRLLQAYHSGMMNGLEMQEYMRHGRRRCGFRPRRRHHAMDPHMMMMGGGGGFGGGRGGFGGGGGGFGGGPFGRWYDDFSDPRAPWNRG